MGWGCGPEASLDVGVQGCCAHERTSLSSKRCSLGLSSVLEGRDRPWEDGHQGGTAQPLLGFGQCRAKLQQRHHVATRRHSNQIKNLLLWRCVRVLVSFRARKSLQRAGLPLGHSQRSAPSLSFPSRGDRACAEGQSLAMLTRAFLPVFFPRLSSVWNSHSLCFVSGVSASRRSMALPIFCTN